MHPIILKLGPLDIHTYGVLVALAFIIGLAVATYRAKKVGIDPDHLSDLGIWLIVAGMGGAKLFHIIFFWPEFMSAWRADGILSLREGFVFYGGFIGASLATVVYTHKKKLPLKKIADICAPSIALGHAIGRLGCFFNGCCYGKICTLPWAVQFPHYHFTHSTRVHPTQIYETIGNLVIFFTLIAFYSRKKFDGQIWWSYILAYGLLRFVIEFFRGDYQTYYLGIFTIGHLIASGLILLSLWALTKKKVPL